MHFTPILMKGAMHWMDLSPEKRTLGNIDIFNQGFGSFIFDLTDPDPFDMEPHENAIKFKMVKPLILVFRN